MEHIYYSKEIVAKMHIYWANMSKETLPAEVNQYVSVDF